MQNIYMNKAFQFNNVNDLNEWLSELPKDFVVISITANTQNQIIVLVKKD